MKGRTTCRMHGGTVDGEKTRGPNSPTWKDGKYSKVFKNTAAAQRYQELVTDPEYAHLHGEIATLRIRMDQAIARSELLDLKLLAEPAQELLEGLEWEAARMRGEKDDADRPHRDALIRQLQQFTMLVDEERADKHLTVVAEAIRRLTDTAHKIEYDEANVVTVATMMAFAQRIGVILREEIADQRTLDLASARIAALFYSRAQQPRLVAAEVIEG
jgi:hypothetical protein